VNQLRIPAVYIAGAATSKGVFFLDEDLPAEEGGRAKKLLLRVIGSPDRYGQAHRRHGRAPRPARRRSSSSRNPVAPTATSTICFGQGGDRRAGDRLVGQTGGNLTTAVRPVSRSAWAWSAAPRDGEADGAHLAGQHPQADRQPRADEGMARVVELGGFELDGVAFSRRRS